MAIDVATPPDLDPSADAPRRPRRTSLIALAAVVVLALVATGITVLTRPPDLGTGSSYGGSPTMKVASDGLSDTKFEIDGNSGGVLDASVTNDGRFPVTILGLDRAAQPTMSVLATIAFVPDPDRPGTRQGGPALRSVTLQPGDEADIRLTVRTPDCLPQEKGSSVIYEAIPVKVRRLGFTRSTAIPLDLPLWVHYSADHPAVGTCP
jgi:hypothetical protein